eukprot:jgi/Picsp_1/1934/NSC_05400-R1_---NA---
MKQSRDHSTAVEESSLEGCREKCKTETDATCEIEGRFRTCADHETSINTLGDLFPFCELFDGVGFSVECNGEPHVLMDNPIVHPVEMQSSGHEPVQMRDTMPPAMDFNNDAYIETSALRDEILVAYKNNHGLRQAVQQQDPENPESSENENDSVISKATNVDLSQEEMESAKACLRLTLKTWILPQSEHHTLGSCIPLGKQNTGRCCSPLLVGNDLRATLTIDQAQDRHILPLLGSSPSPCLDWDGDTPISEHLSRDPKHLSCNQEEDLPSNPFCTSSVLLDSYSTILDDDFLSLFDSSSMKNSLLLD